MTPAFSPGPWSTRSPELGSRFRSGAEMLVAAMLRPEEGEDRELEVVRVAFEQLADAGVLGVGKTERLMERLFRDPRQGAESSRLAGRVQGP